MTRMFTHRAGWTGDRPAQSSPPPGATPSPTSWPAFILAGAAMLGSLLLSQPAAAQPRSQAIFAPGDAIVTGFSGIKSTEDAPPQDADPLDYFFIDPAGASMKIFQIGDTGEANAKLLTPPAQFTVPASDVGQVFAIALDDGSVISTVNGPAEGEDVDDGGGNADPVPSGDDVSPTPNIYLGATSVFGLNIVVPGDDGKPRRVKQGAPGAVWMDGQFGTAKNGGPGSIWRVDGTTGEVTLFADITTNSGPGIGKIVYDRGTRQFFASDLDSGLIHRIGADGNVIDSFDHGTMARPLAGKTPLLDDGGLADITSPAFDTEKPESWGFTQRERMVWGMAVHGGRLYYAVQGVPEIWSVAIEADGGFGKDARLEFDVEGLAGNTYISDMSFDAKGRLYLAQRGEFRGSYDYSVFAEPRKSDVLRYARDPRTGQWNLALESYAIGFPESHASASGGIAIGQCGTRLWTTGDNLRNNPGLMEQLAAGGAPEVHGLQGNDIELVRPQNEPPFKTWFVDYDGQFGDPEKAGHVGDVEMWQSCPGGQSIGGYGEYYLPPYGELPPGWVPPSRDRFNLRLTKRAAPRVCHRHGGHWACRFVIRVRNTGPNPYFGPISVNDTLPGLPAGSTVNFAFQPPWNCAVLGANDFRCNYPPVFLAPGAGVDLFVRVRVPLRTRECRINNHASIHWPVGVGDANPADDNDSATAIIPARHCKPDRTNLKLEKRFVRCVRSGQGFRCAYRIVVTNTGPGQYNGQISVEDQVPAGTTAIFPGAGWACGGAAPTYNCTRGPVSLNSGDSVNLGVIVNVPVDVARRMECRIRNIARITHAPGGSPDNTDPGDDKDSAVATLPDHLCDQQQTNLKLEKRVDDNGCQRGDGVSRCYYNIRVTNAGPGHYNGMVQVRDTVPAGATATFSAGWACAGGSPAYDCSRNVNLVPGATVTLGVQVNVPDGVAREMQCSVHNEGRIILAPGGSPRNTNPADDTDAATAFIPRLCDQTLPVPIVEKPRCPPGFLWSGQRCYRPERPECPPHTHGKWPRCIPNEQCPPRMHMSHGHCCPKGTEWNGKRCDEPATQTCPPGTHGKYPRCIADETPRCPGRLHMSHGHCCPPGKEWNGKMCTRGGGEDRVCPPGTHGKHPRCIANETPRCPGRLHMSHGHCCPPGKEWNGKMCTRGGGEDRVCPSGTHGKYPRCKPISHCPTGTVGKYPHCRKVHTHCPSGTVRKGRSCTPSRVIRKGPNIDLLRLERQRARQLHPMHPRLVPMRPQFNPMTPQIRPFGGGFSKPR